MEQQLVHQTHAHMLRFTIVDCLNSVDGLKAHEIDDLFLKKEKVLDKSISHAASWFK